MSNFKTAYSETWGANSDLNIFGKIILSPIIICLFAMALLWDLMDSTLLKKNGG